MTHARQDFSHITGAIAAEQQRLQQEVKIPGVRESFQMTKRLVEDVVPAFTTSRVVQISPHATIKVPIPWLHGDAPVTKHG